MTTEPAPWPPMAQKRLELIGLPECKLLECLPKTETPAWRVSWKPSECSMVELLAAIIGGPKQLETAYEVMEKLGKGLARATLQELQAVRGVGPQTAVRLVAASELFGRRMGGSHDERTTINSPADAAALLMDRLSAKDQEHLYTLLIDTRNRLIGEAREIYHGSLNTSMIRVGEIFREAIRCNAASVIVIHNHPSGDPSPSPEDVAVTRSLVEAGKLLDIEVLDHLVIGDKRFVSLKERNLGF